MRRPSWTYTGLVRPRTFPASVFLAVALLAAGCQEDSGGDVVNTTAPQSLGEGQVLIKGIAFTPTEVRTTVGKPVTWTFDDGGLEHTVTADDKSFDSGRKGSGTFDRTFSAAGTVAYHCEVHSRMKGTVVVG